MKKPLLSVAMALSALLLHAKRPHKHAPAELYTSDFKSSSRRLGLYFPDSLRQIFRFHWLRLKK
jgi:hypothetical protein